MANQSSLPFFWREGESEKLWKDPGRTIERARKERQAEAERAANILGVVDIEFFNLGITLCVRTRSPGKSWPIFSLCCARVGCLRTRSMILTISTTRRRPAFAKRRATSHRRLGARGQRRPLGLRRYSSLSRISPSSVRGDLSSFWMSQMKRRAFESMQAQEDLWEYYTRSRSTKRCSELL